MKQIGKSDAGDIAAFEASLNATQKVEFQMLNATIKRVDTENTKRLGEIVDQHGWPTYALVGRDGAQAAWLLVQHTDLSPTFQRKCLELMDKVPRDRLSRRDVASLTDRVLLAEGKKQVYGTQVSLRRGKCVPSPLEDEANVDRRRREVGLSPLVEYLKSIGDLHVGGSEQ